MSQLVKLLRSAGRSSGRPTAGFGTRGQDSGRKRLIVVAALDSADAGKARAAFQAGADAVEIPYRVKLPDLKDLTAAGPVGLSFSGSVPGDFDFRALEDSGLDYVSVEAGDVPAGVLLLEGPSVVVAVKESFSDTMLKTLNFLPARIIQVDAPENVARFTVKQAMEKRVGRELIGKPLLLKVGPGIKPEAAQVLALVAPNGLIVPAADVAAWKAAVADLKEPSEDDDGGASNISLKAPAA